MEQKNSIPLGLHKFYGSPSQKFVT